MKRNKLFAPHHEPVYDEPVWLGVSRSSGYTWIILALLVIVFFVIGVGAVLGKIATGFLLFLLLIGLLVVLALAALADTKVLIDSNGIHARCGMFGWPRKTLAWNEITAVRAADIHPAKIGAIGFRWYSIREGSAFIMRSGPGIEIREKNGQRFVITLEEAEAAAAFSQQFLT